MHKVFLGIGGNIGNKEINFQKVHNLIEKEIGTVTGSSAIYETSAWGFESADLFWNQVLMIASALSPSEILEKIKKIETVFGRTRQENVYSSREMDIDILYFDHEIMHSVDLVIPHPLMQKRLFVLVPLAEIAPELMHPVLKLTSSEMLAVCDDKSVIRKVEKS